jgi:hypothetical protein
MTRLLYILTTVVVATAAVAAQKAGPIIDMHVHGEASSVFSHPNPNPLTGRDSGFKSEREHMLATLREMKRFNVVKGIASGPRDVVARWRAEDPTRIIASPYFEGTADNPLPDLVKLSADYSAGIFAAMGEIGAIYGGLSPNDPRLEPYFALAEKLDMPVGVHTGLGPPGTAYDPCCPNFRITLGDPRLLENVLIRHPKLRLYIMHAGWPYLEETKALMQQYPQVYADVAVIDWVMPREEFHEYLRPLIRAQLGKRLMFGSDQMQWPEVIGMAIANINAAKFLTRQQKRDIFYNNAARFLRLEK